MLRLEGDLLSNSLVFLLDQLLALLVQPGHEFVHVLHHEPLLVVVGQGVLQVLVHFVDAECDVVGVLLPRLAHQLCIGHELAVRGEGLEGEIVIRSGHGRVHDLRVRDADLFGCPNVGDSNTGLILVFTSLFVFDSLIKRVRIIIH